MSTEAAECSASQVKCGSEDRCIPLSYLCDGGNDCDEGEDEDSTLCQVSVDIQPPVRLD